MAGKKKDKKPPSSTIALNKKAGHDYALTTRFECGVALEGWEVKAIRAGKVQLRDAYVLLNNGEAYLHGAHISPLQSASTHVVPDTIRARKLLLHRHELNQLVGAVERKGMALLATAMYWKKGRVKVEIALGKGKKLHDKRTSEKDRDWQRTQSRIMKSSG